MSNDKSQSQTSVTKGYQPTSQPTTNNNGKPHAGHQPTISQGSNPGNPPKKP